MTALNVLSARRTITYSQENVDLIVQADMSRVMEDAYLAKPRTAILALLMEKLALLALSLSY